MLWKGFQKPKRLTVASEPAATDTYAQFSAQPFERGFGTTIGNALRRVLLSSIEGAAITAVKIEGVLHEFSSIPGVVEDATDIILNLKQIPLKLHGEDRKTIYLKGLQPGVFTSGNIEHDADIEILETGLRPGEKLHEELWWDSANAKPSSHPQIMLGDVGLSRSQTRTLVPLIRELVEKDYSWESRARVYEELYQRVIEERRRGTLPAHTKLRPTIEAGHRA